MLTSVCPCLACLINSFKQLFSDRGSKPITATSEHQPERIMQWKQESVISEEITNQSQNVIKYANKQQVKSKPAEEPSVITESQNGYGQDLLFLDDEDRTLYFQQILLNVPEYGPDYHLLKEKTYIAPGLLKLSKDWKMIKIKENGLKKDENMSSLQLKVWKKSDFKYLIQYQLPCTYEAYQQMNSRQIPNDLKIPSIKQSKILQQIQQNLTLRYICFDRIGMLQSRYFTYLKYTIPCKTDPSAYWQLCVSRQNQKNVNLTGNSAKPGKLFIVSHIKEKKNIQEGTTSLKIITYFDVDISTTVQKVWERIIVQTKEYLQEFCRKLVSNSDNLL